MFVFEKEAADYLKNGLDATSKALLRTGKSKITLRITRDWYNLKAEKARKKAKRFQLDDSDPEEVREMYEQIKLRFVQASRCHGQLAVVPAAERYPIMKQMLSLLKKNTWAWADIRYYKRYGQLPDSEGFEETDPLRLFHRRQNLRTYKSREKDEGQKAKYEAEILRITEYLKSLGYEFV